MQSFLGSLNYYSRFIEDFAIYASVLYELRELDYYEIRRINGGHVPKSKAKADQDRSWKEMRCDHTPQYAYLNDRSLSTEDGPNPGERNRYDRVHIAES